jgi:hypothetical protein
MPCQALHSKLGGAQRFCSCYCKRDPTTTRKYRERERKGLFCFVCFVFVLHCITSCLEGLTAREMLLFSGAVICFQFCTSSSMTQHREVSTTRCSDLHSHSRQEKQIPAKAA